MRLPSIAAFAVLGLASSVTRERRVSHPLALACRGENPRALGRRNTKAPSDIVASRKSGLQKASALQHLFKCHFFTREDP